MSLTIHHIGESMRARIEAIVKPYARLDLEEIARDEPDRFKRLQAEIGSKLYHAMPSLARDEISTFSTANRDHVILRGLPVDKEQAETPKTFWDKRDNTVALPILFGLAALTRLPVDAKRGALQTIRVHEHGQANMEPWHGHPEFRATMFYCHKGDPRARIYVARAREIFREAAGRLPHTLVAPHRYAANEGPFALMQMKRHHVTFAEELYRHPQEVADLRLADVLATLDDMIGQARPKSPEADALTHIRAALKNSSDSIVYEPGDVALYDEHQTLRHSPAFHVSNRDGHERWLQSIAFSGP